MHTYRIRCVHNNVVMHPQPRHLPPFILNSKTSETSIDTRMPPLIMDTVGVLCLCVRMNTEAPGVR
jgi:hypothetical protein